MLIDLFLVVVGFSLIIFLHELGHFVAARWAGIRVLAFAMGFGPALFSFRKGLGMRGGSSEAHYIAMVKAGTAAGVSSTEYRWNALPLGGYVKMLGQDDADPTAKSDAPDSFQMCVPWKRLVVISAGVVMNMITAAVLFVVVFSIGLETESPAIGMVAPNSPAAKAVATNAQNLGVMSPGLKPGDVVTRIAGEEPLSFKDVAMEVLMSAKGEPIDLRISRPGIAESLAFSIVPETDKSSRLLSLGIAPAASKVLRTSPSAAERELIAKDLVAFGLATAGPGAELTGIDGHATASVYDLANAARASSGRPLSLEFTRPDGTGAVVSVTPKAELSRRLFTLQDGIAIELAHIVGFVPVMKVERADETGKSGLASQDIFARIGDVQWPSMLEGISEIRRRAGKTVNIVVLRDGAQKNLGEVKVSSEGRVGFVPSSTADDSTVIARWPSATRFELPDEVKADLPAGAILGLPPGSRILKVAGEPVGNFTEIRNAVRAAAGSRNIGLLVQLPATAQAGAQVVQQTLALSKVEAEAVGGLAWMSPVPADLFQPRQTTLRAISPVAAIGMGLHETKRVMLQTYVTFARLFQGSVKVEHLSGPIGIARAGVQLADRGFIWLLFFMAVISINLAVVNFLPLPIVDGGHFVFILYEQFTGKPVNVAVQNAAALAGLAFIGCMFLIVTYNDLANWLWR